MSDAYNEAETDVFDFFLSNSDIIQHLSPQVKPIVFMQPNTTNDICIKLYSISTLYSFTLDSDEDKLSQENF